MTEPRTIRTFRGTWEEILSHQPEIPPDSIIELRVFPPAANGANPQEDVGDFDGRTIGEAFPDLLRLNNEGPPDLAARAKEYLTKSGFGGPLRGKTPFEVLP